MRTMEAMEALGVVSHLQFRSAMEGESTAYIDPSAMTAQTEIFLRVSIFVFHTNVAGRRGPNPNR